MFTKLSRRAFPFAKNRIKIPTKNYHNLTKPLEQNEENLIKLNLEESENNKNPYDLISEEIETSSSRLKKMLAFDDRFLGELITHFIDKDSKKIRPMVNILLAKTLGKENMICDRQISLSEVSQLIHISKLIHGDVEGHQPSNIGHSRRLSTLNRYGDKLAILGGDYFLSKASSILADIRNSPATELMSQTILDAVEGEFYEVSVSEAQSLDELLNEYCKKNYLLDSSLFANSCRSIALIENCGKSLNEASFRFGKYFGLCYHLTNELIDSVDFENVKLNLKRKHLTAPIIFASQENSLVREVLTANSSSEEVIEKAAEQCLDSAKVLGQCKILSDRFLLETIKSAMKFPDSKYRRALISLLKTHLDQLPLQ